jgi:hypothetical protein
MHYNNWSCHPGWAPLKSSAYQVLLVNKRIGQIGPPRAGWPALASVVAPGLRNAGEETARRWSGRPGASATIKVVLDVQGA